jgi:hypothetical protein
MSPANEPRKILQSIGAVVAGALTGILLSVGTDALMHAQHIFTENGQPLANSLLLLATAYRTVYGVLGAWLTARLAPRNPMAHVIVLGSLGLIASAAGAAATWNKGPEFASHWYPVALVILAVPTAWLGGKLGLIQVAHRKS